MGRRLPRSAGPAGEPQEVPRGARADRFQGARDSDRVRRLPHRRAHRFVDCARARALWLLVRPRCTFVDAHALTHPPRKPASDTVLADIHTHHRGRPGVELGRRHGGPAGQPDAQAQHALHAAPRRAARPGQDPGTRAVAALRRCARGWLACFLALASRRSVCALPGSRYLHGFARMRGRGPFSRRSLSSLCCLAQISYISCGQYHTAAVSDRGLLYTWGSAKYGQLGHNSKLNERFPRLVRPYRFSAQFLHPAHLAVSSASVIRGCRPAVAPRVPHLH